MKYKNVFLIWLWADLFLIVVAVCFWLAGLIRDSVVSDDFTIFLLAIGIGILFSLPSLVIMLLFHTVFIKKSKNPAAWFKPYLVLILAINILYFVIVKIAYDIENNLMLFFLFSTISGLLALFLMSRRIKNLEATSENTIL